MKSRSRFALAVLLAAGCGSDPGGAGPAGSAAASASPTPSAAPASAAMLAQLRSAEQQRLVSPIFEAASTDRDPAVRVAAARALARIGGADARAGLRRALADELPEVVTWAAYGLSFACEGAKDEIVSALAARAVALEGAAADDPRPFAAIARTIGRCAGQASESTLAAWLAAPADRGRAAALALSDLASVQKRLREETLASLLQAAQGTVAEKPALEALVPIARLQSVPPSVRKRLVEVATGRLGQRDPLRLHAIKALARGGNAASEHLRRVAEDAAGFTPSERAEAVRGLVLLGRDGADDLAALVVTLARDATADGVSRIEPSWSILPLAASSLTSPGEARDTLAKLAVLAPPEGLEAPRARRLAHVRCAAARALAGGNPGDPLLVGCDPTRSWIGELAVVGVLDRGKLEGARLARWTSLLGATSARTREAALELLGGHREIEGAAAIIATALAAPEPGVVGTAAELVAKHPLLASAPAERSKATKKKGDARGDAKDASGAKDAAAEGPTRGDDRSGGSLDPRVGKALVAALERAMKADDAEVLGALADAAGAAAAKETRGMLETLCSHPVPDVRRHTAAALGLLDGKKRLCEAPPGGAREPAELGHLLGGPTRVVLTTDVGELVLELDPTLAPVAATRIADLAAKAYFDGKVFHRVVPGFVAQVGAPHADGWGGADGLPALRCETSPLPYDPLVVGMALAGRDTGSSQFFVTLARHPHLDGGYAVVGKASGPWESLAEGDVLSAARVDR